MNMLTSAVWKSNEQNFSCFESSLFQTRIQYFVDSAL